MAFTQIGGNIGGQSGGTGLAIEGVEELLSVLDSLSHKDVRKPIEIATQFAGRRLRKDMRNNIPIDRQRSKKVLKSGKRSKSLVVGDTQKMAKKSIGTALRRYWKDGNVVLVVGPRRDFYAHNGERIDKILIGIEKGWRGREPKPFMAAVYNRGKATVPKDFMKRVKPLLEKAAKDAAVRSRPPVEFPGLTPGGAA